MSESESRVQSLVRLAAANQGHKLLRNNSGAATDATGRVIRYGLGHDSAALNKVYKSPDLIGWTRVTITPDMVGKTLAVFTAVECKGGDFKGAPRNDRERAQAAFLQDVSNAGGLACFAASEDDYLRVVTCG